MLLEKLGGVAVIAISVTILSLVSIYDPPTFIQIIIAFVGSCICLVGIVIVFAENQIWPKGGQGMTSPKAGKHD